MGIGPFPLLVAAALCTLATTSVAVGTYAPATASPGRWLRALIAGVIGAGLGVLLVTDYTIGWGFRGAVPALALIPSAVGGFWAGRHLSRLHAELPRALRGVPAWYADRITFGGPGLIILGGSVLRLVVATVALSVGCVLLSPAMSGTVTAGLFVGFGCLALATLLVSLLVTLGRLGSALLAVSVSVLAEAVLQLPHALTQPGSGLIAGTSVAALLTIPPIIKLFLRPGRTLATAMWIT
jgi:hypothetical protein